MDNSQCTSVVMLCVSLVVDQGVPEGTCTDVAKFYSRLRLIRSVLRASKFFVLKLTEIVILWVFYTIPFGFSLIWHFWASLFNYWATFYGASEAKRHLVWLRTTDEGSLPEMRIWSIFLIISGLKWCIYLGRSLFSY